MEQTIAALAKARGLALDAFTEDGDKHPHPAVTVEPGIWQVSIVREYDHFAEEARRVMD